MGSRCEPVEHLVDVGGGRRCVYAGFVRPEQQLRLIAVDISAEELALNTQVDETYVANVVARTTALYGTIGAIFGLLAFLYATMWLFLLGAEFSRFSAERDAASEH